MDSLEDQIAVLLQSAVEHHRGGRITEAIAGYQEILRRKNDHDNALHLLGVAAAQTGQAGKAIELIRKAIDINPDAAEYHANLGKALRSTGGIDDAIQAFRQATRLAPDSPDFHTMLAETLQRGGQLDESVSEYRRAMVLHPQSAQTRDRMLAALGNAIAAHRKALALDPKDASRYAALAGVYRDNGQLDDALNCLNRAIDLQPRRATFHSELGVVLDLRGSLDQAMAACRKAIQLDPNDANAYCNLGHALAESGRYQEAILEYERAVRLAPNWPAAHLNLGLSLLTCGDLARGWPEYAWRWRIDGAPPIHAGVSQPMWDGSSFAGKTLLLRPEQGLGDTIQFIRYLPMVLARGGRVIFSCQPLLKRLLQQMTGLELVGSRPLPPFDLHCTLLHLPHIFDARLETIPPETPYLHADRTLVDSWSATLAPGPGRLRIGLAWAGNPTLKDDRRRSVSLSQLAPLARAGATFFSLQKGPASSQAAHPPSNLDLVDLTAGLQDFADTAALISHLDLVISVDTAVAHLAGAMGKPVWLLLPFKPDWRWMLGRDDSPWYPTMRLFRQQSPGNWGEVIDRVAQCIQSQPTLK